MIEKRSGESNPVAYGPKYTDIFNRVLAPSSDPNRIGDITELYKAEGAGDLTSKGTERLVVDKRAIEAGSLSIGAPIRERSIWIVASRPAGELSSFIPSAPPLALILATSIFAAASAGASNGFIGPPELPS